VTSSNDAPTITSIANSTIVEDGATPLIPFTIGDVETAAASLTLLGTSSDPTLVPNANIVFGGSGANRTVRITPAANQFGTASISVSVNDGATSSTEDLSTHGDEQQRSADDSSASSGDRGPQHFDCVATGCNWRHRHGGVEPGGDRHFVGHE
jgi:hypothetical protein